MKTNVVSLFKTNGVGFCKSLVKHLIALFALVAALNAFAAADLEVNTPGVQAVKARMQARHAQLLPYYVSGAVGLNLDGTIVLRDIASVPLAARQGLNMLVDAENQDRDALYAEIANANGHPEWQTEIRSTFAQRWIQHAHGGWWVMSGSGWVQK